LTAHSNDYSFDSVFSRQIEALGNQNDVLCAISTSGNSRNILMAAQAAQSKGMRIIAMTGENGGLLAPLATLAVRVPSSITARIQEAHILIAHFWCAVIEQRLVMD
jgi:D-sedoheptulose 7-phosphate isomerase